MSAERGVIPEHQCGLKPKKKFVNEKIKIKNICLKLMKERIDYQGIC